MSLVNEMHLTVYSLKVIIMDIISETAKADKGYMQIVADILSNQKFLRLGEYRHHSYLTRLDHCIHVSFSCYLKNKHKGYKYFTDMVRGALLHDFFLYDYKAEKGVKRHWLHGFYHPKVSYLQATHEFKLTAIEKSVILRHMFPLTLIPPLTKAAWCVVFYDKYWAIKELLNKGDYAWDVRRIYRLLYTY